MTDSITIWPLLHLNQYALSLSGCFLHSHQMSEGELSCYLSPTFLLAPRMILIHKITNNCYVSAVTVHVPVTRPHLQQVATPTQITE